MNESDLGCETGEEGRLLESGVATADDSDVLVAEEEAVTGSAPADSVTGELLLIGQAELAICRTGCKDHRLCGVACTQSCLDLVSTRVELEGLDVVVDDFGSELLGLLTHALHEFRTLHTGGESGKVLDIGGVHQFAACGHRSGDDDR